MRQLGTDRRHPTRHRGIYFRNGSNDPDDPGQRRYIVWFEDSEGKGRTETLPVGSTLADALVRQAEVRGKKSRGERVLPTKLTLGSLADDWLESQKPRLKPKTVAQYTWAIEKQIKPRIGRLKVMDVTVDDVARLIVQMQVEGKKAWTIRGVLTPLSRMMQAAVRRGHISQNPVRALDRSERPKDDQKRMRILDTDEIAKLLPAVPDLYRPLITTLVFTGMRISEALALEWRDVDFDQNVIRVRSSKTRAGEREIAIMPELSALLRRHKLASGRVWPDAVVFASRKGTTLSARNALARGLEKPCETIGIPHVTLHELRHTYASILIGRGMDVTYVSDQLGHANPSITLKTYAKLFDPASRREEAREKLSAAFGGMV